MCMSVLPACIYVYHVHAWHSQRPKESIRSTGIGVTDGCELLCGTVTTLDFSTHSLLACSLPLSFLSSLHSFSAGSLLLPRLTLTSVCG